MLKNKLTPLLRQYLEVKQNHKDCLIFFRLGDFYELFFEDAELAAKCLGITLTKRGQIDGKDVPMCGVPHHHGENYLSKLLRRGFKVAICEQIEKPEQSKKRGYKEIIKRKVVRIATPGTLTEEKELLNPENNYLMSISFLNYNFHLTYIDISTGEVNLRNCPNQKDVFISIEEINPSEILIPKDNEYKFLLKEKKVKKIITFLENSFLNYENAKKNLIKSYYSNSNFDISNYSKNEIISLGSTMSFISYTQDGKVPIFSLPSNKEKNNYLEIDNSTRRNLEIIKTLNGESEGSLFNSLNFTHTSSGSRKLLSDISNPLNKIDKIKRRQELVSFFYNNFETIKDKIVKNINQFPDVARSLNRLSLGRGGPRDLFSIQKGLEKTLLVSDILKKEGKQKLKTNPFVEYFSLLKKREILEVIDALNNALADNLPNFSRDGNFIKTGFDPQLDKVRSYRDNAKKLILGQEGIEKKNTGINNLKIKYNNYLGYFLDVSSSNNSKIKKHEDYYIHRQSLKNSFRYTTKKLIEISENIFNANFEVQELEHLNYTKLVNNVLKISDQILRAANIMSRVDVAFSWALYAKKYTAVKPEINSNNDFEVVDGRHPSVEKTHVDNFISNSCMLNNNNINIFKLITGPNMSGKSTYLRQNALILVIAQAGGFCPAEKVKIGICDKLFCRVGSGDELSKGNSTFMVEMLETANILNTATEKSLVVLDEIGRGTSTYDGMSLAWATTEYLINKIKCKTLFATHYNELSKLSKEFNQLELNTFRVKEWKGDLIFLHQLVEGVAKSSYGIQVAKMAGIPEVVTLNAKKILKRLEGGIVSMNEVDKQTLIDFAYNKKKFVLKEIEEKIKKINLSKTTPLEALNFLQGLQEKIKDKT